MMPEDAILQWCNESELLWLARLQGLPILRRGLPREELIAIVSGAYPVQETHLAGTNYTRGRLEDFVQLNIDRLRSQLPGCTGRCRSYMCTEGKHMSCFVPSEPLLI
jgi:hypothetical protein